MFSRHSDTKFKKIVDRVHLTKKLRVNRYFNSVSVIEPSTPSPNIVFDEELFTPGLLVVNVICFCILQFDSLLFVVCSNLRLAHQPLLDALNTPNLLPLIFPLVFSSFHFILPLHSCSYLSVKVYPSATS